LLGKKRSEQAILILDMINEFGHLDGNRFESGIVDIIPYVQGELQYFRERMRPVIFCNSELPNDAGDESLIRSQVIQALSPRTGEISIKKTHHNAFYKTDLANILAALDVCDLTIVGAFSHESVIITAAAAIDHGYAVVIPETCILGDNQQDHQAALRLINRWLKA
jgi:nicotinamidase-related amidase